MKERQRETGRRWDEEKIIENNIEERCTRVLMRE